MSIQLHNKYDPTQPYHIYYDLDAVNNQTTGGTAPVRFTLTEVRNNPFLMTPDNYFMSVVRFSLQTPTLPVFIPAVELGQANPNQLSYSFTLTYNNGGTVFNSTQTFLTYVCSDSTIPTPPAPLTFQDNSNEYYWVYNLQDFVKMMNTALITAFANLNAAVIAGGFALPSLNVPFFEFDPTAQKFILNADNAAFNSTLANQTKIFINTPLYTLLNNFPMFKNAPLGVALGKNYQFNFYNNNGLNLFNMGLYSAIQLYQDNSTTGLFNPVNSIVFTTSLLPIVPSVVGVPRAYGGTSGLNTGGNNSNLSPIITDFQIPYSAVNQYRPTLEYTPNGEYRLIDLLGMNQQSAIEITVLWKDQYGVLRNFFLGSGCSASIKLMFRRKDYGNVDL
tara:strand:+ start:786 stop:1955 length:1170 start_codon:yes stop_codon:yes gene_type:complete